jgi:23S rRNA pseudouridine1911/1915/1917 synthase
MKNKEVEFEVLDRQSGERLDKFLAESVLDLSRSRAKQLIGSGLVRVNGEKVAPSYRLSGKENVVVEIPLVKKLEIEPESIPLSVVYEDKDVLVVDKPAGIVVHPAAGHLKGTLVNALLSYVEELKFRESLRPGIVHRLDKDTSGLMVVAKNEPAEESLRNQFKNRAVVKKYLVLVHGELKEDFGVVEAPIRRHPVSRKKFSVSLGGKEAITEFRVLKRFRDFTYLEAQPKTGRTHQIRVHFSHLKHPLVGDALYGGKKLLGRQFLHASVLGFKLPSTGQYVEFKSGLPNDLNEFLATLRN